MSRRPSRFLRGLRTWVGLRQTGYEYARAARYAGASKYSLPKLMRLTGVFAGCLVALYITFEAPLSGMSMNPARTVASALPDNTASLARAMPPVALAVGLKNDIPPQRSAAVMTRALVEAVGMVREIERRTLIAG